MKNKQYYFLDEQNRICGPFEFDELGYLNLYKDTLVSIDSADKENFVPLKNLPELTTIKLCQGSVFSIYDEYGKEFIAAKLPEKTTETNSNGKKGILSFSGWLIFCLLIGISLAYFYPDPKEQFKDPSQQKAIQSDSKSDTTVAVETNEDNITDLNKLIESEREPYMDLSISPMEINSEEFRSKPEYEYNNEVKKIHFLHCRSAELREYGTFAGTNKTEISRNSIYKNTLPLGAMVTIVHDSFFKKTWISYTDEDGYRQIIKISESTFSNLHFARYIWSFRIGKDIYDIL